MQLKKIKIHNIASIEDAEIDFTSAPLEGAPIFLICGETGAGKSTVLDALCLALYGDTPRMSSSVKEEIELSDDPAQRYYANDNSQLLRRGAGEGFARLSFVGNDGKDYVSEWEIHRAHNKPGKRLLRPSRRLEADDGSFCDTRTTEINPKITEITGLQYEQFCRTVMLAQGEFTRFLKSRKEEKSEILEKLTGTGIYSRLGIMIAEKFSMIRNEWEEAKQALEGIEVFSEEKRSEMESRLGALGKESASALKERELADRKLNWLERDSEIAGMLAKERAISESLKSKTESDEFQRSLRLMADYDATEQVRRMIREEGMEDSLIRKNDALLPSLKINLEKCAADAAVALSALEESERNIENKNKEYEAFNTEKLNERSRRLAKESEMIAAMAALWTELQSERNVLSSLSDNRKVSEKALNEAVEKIGAAQIPMAEVEKSRKLCVEELESAEISMSEAARELRHVLREGDICPVCGSKVEKKLNDVFFESILEPLRHKKREAEEKCLSVRSELKAMEKIRKTETEKLKMTDKKIKMWEEKISSIEKSLSKTVVKAGYDGCDLPMAMDTSVKDKERIDCELKEIRELQKQADMVLKDLKGLRKINDSLGAACRKCNDSLTQARMAVGKIEAERVVHMETKVRKTEEIEAFLKSHREYDRESLSLLDKEDRKRMSELAESLRKDTDDLKNSQIRQEALAAQAESHGKASPWGDDGISEEKADIESHRATLNASIIEKNREIGRIGKELDTDRHNRKILAREIQSVEEARGKKEKWEGLYNRLGDLRGSKFRTVAQSFILGALLDNANLYMRSFTDRYTLTCNPGTLAILVKDCYRPTSPQPASILSGGESFMASLALALALANLKGGGLGADIIFIDEGFGTLSPEFLGNVMDTLERLHRIGGRRVGLISHVSEMKERIPVHVELVRDNPSLSHIEIKG